MLYPNCFRINIYKKWAEGTAPKSFSYELPISQPVRNTRIPPTTT